MPEIPEALPLSLAPVVILACGNPSRGDDALGPLLLDRLQEWLDAAGLAEGFELISDFQWQIEHALDLMGRRLALFIDAGMQTPAPLRFGAVPAIDAAIPGTHALSPTAVLAVLPRIAQPAPPAFVLCVSGQHFELGDGLSAVAIRHADWAFELLQALCRSPWIDAWQASISGD
ncbi:hydrogenase maturation protease [Candidatus Accumulibacter phosphatis]|uniref:hydrogenase maturation protease n=1 Tax=Candidatus Accumulibacter phosphatis TaxID=327160 RepID=UPI001FE5F8D7|nr:hydrogenase maturation protease [Candidatus Accumulibacter phosphatis]